MTTSECIVCNVLSCGENDIEFMFDKMTESGLFCDAWNEMKDSGCHITANSLWAEGIRIAVERVFGEEYLEDFDIDANCHASGITFIGDKDGIINFEEKIDEFYRLTGFEPTF